MAGVKGRSGIGSGGAGRGQGKKRNRVILEKGASLSMARIGNDGTPLSPLTQVEVVSVGGESGHDQQFTLISADETITFFVNPAPESVKVFTPKKNTNKRK